MKKMETLKVFECQEMPDDVRTAFFELTDGYPNDIYVAHYVGDALKEETENPGEYEKKILVKYRLLENWLKLYGAKDGEKVLIAHWW